MHVRVEIQFASPDTGDWEAVRKLGSVLTTRPEEVQVTASDQPGWLIVDFAMRTDAQIRAVDRIDRIIRMHLGNRLESIIRFPPTEAQRLRNKRKSARRKLRNTTQLNKPSG